MISCYLCEKIYLPKETFQLYLCYDCNNYTSFCLNCDKLMMKIFENNNMFKCGACKKIAPASVKQLIEVTNLIDSNQVNASSNINENILSPNKNDNDNIINNINFLSPNNNNNNINISSPNNNTNDNNNNIYINNSHLNSPFEKNYIYHLIGNKIAINTPSINSSFFSEIKANNIPNHYNDKNTQIQKDNQNNNNINNLSILTDNNTPSKIKNNFQLKMNKDGMTLIKNKPKMFDYFNLNDSKDLQESFNKNENGNKSNFNGYNKKDKNNHKKEISYYKKI